VCIYPSAYKIIEAHSISPRLLCILLRPKVTGYFILNILHLSSGDQFENQRIEELESAFTKNKTILENAKYKERNTCKILLGDLNQEL